MRLHLELASVFLGSDVLPKGLGYAARAETGA